MTEDMYDSAQADKIQTHVNSAKYCKIATIKAVKND